MIKEAYCSYEVAKLLKEKGFDEPCRTYYQDGKFVDIVCTQFYQWNSKSLFGQISAPTHQIAVAWILEKYNISIETSVLKHNCWCYTIYKILNNKVEEIYNDGPFESLYECTEAALKYILKWLL